MPHFKIWIHCRTQRTFSFTKFLTALDGLETIRILSPHQICDVMPTHSRRRKGWNTELIIAVLLRNRSSYFRSFELQPSPADWISCSCSYRCPQQTLWKLIFRQIIGELLQSYFYVKHVLAQPWHITDLYRSFWQVSPSSLVFVIVGTISGTFSLWGSFLLPEIYSKNNWITDTEFIAWLFA